jgi:hypothetical protein
MFLCFNTFIVAHTIKSLAKKPGLPMPLVRPSFYLPIMMMHAATLLPMLTQAQNLPPPTRTMYKCTVQGVTSYSDSPCLGATRMEVEPTRGASKLTGKERVGQDVFYERQHEAFAEAVRPLTGMNPKQLATQSRRTRLAPAAQRECAALDQSMPAAELDEQRAVSAELRQAQERLYLMRQRFKELRC